MIAPAIKEELTPYFNLRGAPSLRVRPSAILNFDGSCQLTTLYFPSMDEAPEKHPGRPAHHPSDMQRRLVQMLASQGIPQAEICRVLGVSEKTLRKRYRRQLDVGAAKLEAALIGHLLRIAGGRGAVALKAIRFTLRARFGWTEFAPRPAG